MDGFNLRHLTLAIALSTSMGAAFAATSNDFVDKAAAGGIAEIETSRLALEKSQSADVKAFANMMITDHSKANDELAAIAKKNDIEVPDTTTLVKQAKEKILDMRDESFDSAYANNQVKAHEDTIALFKKEANTVTDDKTKGATELKGFAQKMLPGLEKHLEMAKKLQAAHPDK
jgi:putative membrane protein